MAPSDAGGSQSCFWTLPRSTLLLLAAHQGIEVESNASEFDLVYALVEGVTGLAEEAVLDIVGAGCSD